MCKKCSIILFIIMMLISTCTASDPKSKLEAGFTDIVLGVEEKSMQSSLNNHPDFKLLVENKNFFYVYGSTYLGNNCLYNFDIKDTKLFKVVVSIPANSSNITTIFKQVVDQLTNEYGTPTKVWDNDPEQKHSWVYRSTDGYDYLLMTRSVPVKESYMIDIRYVRFPSSSQKQ